MAIADYLRKLVELKNQLVMNLKSMGVTADESEKLNTLVPKVLECKTEQNVEFVEGTDFAGTSSASGVLSAISKVVIPDGTTKIGAYAFYNCKSLESVTIPDSVTSIGDKVFYDCKSLTTLTAPGNVLSVGSYVFNNCKNIKKLIISEGTTIISKIPINFYDSSYNYPPDNAKQYVEEVVIPNSVTKIGREESDDTSGRFIAFYEYSSLKTINIPDSVTSIGDSAFAKCSSLASIKIGNSVTSIGNDVFSGCTSLKNITIPDSVTSIGRYAFNICASLESVTIGNSVTSIGECAFYGCKSLESVTIPDSVIEIGGGVFYLCASLKEVIIPDTISSLPDYEASSNYKYGFFEGCTNLANIYYAGTEEQWNAITKGTNWRYNMGSDVGGTTIHYNYTG